MDNIKTNISGLSYDTMLEMLVKNMGEFTGHTNACCGLVQSTSSLLKTMKTRVEKDQTIAEEQSKTITLQIDEALSILDDSQSGIYSNLDCLRGQLEAYRVMCKSFRETGLASGDISLKFNSVEKALSPNNKE